MYDNCSRKYRIFSNGTQTYICLVLHVAHGKCSETLSIAEECTHELRHTCHIENYIGTTAELQQSLQSSFVKLMLSFGTDGRRYRLIIIQDTVLQQSVYTAKCDLNDQSINISESRGPNREGGSHAWMSSVQYSNYLLTHFLHNAMILINLKYENIKS